MVRLIAHPIKSEITRHAEPAWLPARKLRHVFGLIGCTLARTYDAMPIYLRLRELRLALGLSQAELAVRAGVRRATVSRLENTRITAIDLKVLEKLADLLRVEPGFLLSRTPAFSPARRVRTRARRERSN
jgi:DNA-binding Xre family transcriptional regulator